MKIGIIGGQGELGSQIFKAFKLKGFSPEKLSRTTPINFNWNNKETYKNIGNFELIINAAPVSDIELYFDFIENNLKEKQVFLETTANINLVNKLIAFKPNVPLKSLVIHGVGLFPGVSNIMAKKLIAAFPNTTDLKFNVKYNIFSQAGKDMCQLMADTLQEPSYYIKNNEIIEDKPVGKVILFKNKNLKINWNGFLARLPDTAYLNAISKKSITVGSYFSPVHNLFMPLLKVVNLLPKNNFLNKIYFTSFFFLRGNLLKNKPSKIMLSAISDNINFISFSAPNAMGAAGTAVLALLPFLKNKIGFFRVDEICEPDVFFTSLKSLDNNLEVSHSFKKN